MGFVNYKAINIFGLFVTLIVCVGFIYFTLVVPVGLKFDR